MPVRSLSTRRGSSAVALLAQESISPSQQFIMKEPRSLKGQSRMSIMVRARRSHVTLIEFNRITKYLRMTWPSKLVEFTRKRRTTMIRLTITKSHRQKMKSTKTVQTTLSKDLSGGLISRKRGTETRIVGILHRKLRKVAHRLKRNL